MENLFLLVLSFLSFGICGFSFYKIMKNDFIEKKNTKNNKETKKNELQNKSPDDIINTYGNPDNTQSDIDKEREEFRKRIQDRLNKRLQG